MDERCVCEEHELIIGLRQRLELKEGFGLNDER